MGKNLFQETEKVEEDQLLLPPTPTVYIDFKFLWLNS